MINKVKIVLGFLSCILLLGCKKEPKVEITRMDISTQADIDFICDNLPDSDTFNGVILVDSEEELDYKCLSNIKHVNGTLSLNGLGVSKAFKNIETIVNGETFNICDEAVDTMYFPKLKVIDTGLGITISSSCNFSNVLYLPNVEKLSGIDIGSPAFDQARSGTFMGFDKLEEMNSIYLDNNNGLLDHFKINGFSSLKKVNNLIHIQSINSAFEVSENSFNNLQEVGSLYLGHSQVSKPNITLEYLFPNIKYAQRTRLNNFDPEEVCFLKDHIQSGDIEIVYFRSKSNSLITSDSLLTLCE